MFPDPEIKQPYSTRCPPNSQSQYMWTDTDLEKVVESMRMG